ncbi:unnamed protein product [Rhizoctonia solani]|uniref:Uncharacterized protein n=1 Tax=Rhizoctonia solani TaxID=456999 RepID=A0A8H3CW22_9AGAM|nr:unnamed protein product [Rhizoctonia solani]
MKHRHGAYKVAADVKATAILIPEDREKPESEPEDPAVAEWSALAQDHYESVEQLSLSVHWSFALIRELDDLSQGTMILLPNLTNGVEDTPKPTAGTTLEDATPMARGFARALEANGILCDRTRSRLPAKLVVLDPAANANNLPSSQSRASWRAARCPLAAQLPFLTTCQGTKYHDHSTA